MNMKNDTSHTVVHTVHTNEYEEVYLSYTSTQVHTNEYEEVYLSYTSTHCTY